MNQRLLHFLTVEKISQSQFADSIGVARASITHIISGRNKPGFDFIVNTAKRYPMLNIEWLLTGEGKMYKTSSDTQELTDDSPSRSITESSINLTSVSSPESASISESKTKPEKVTKTLPGITDYHSEGQGILFQLADSESQSIKTPVSSSRKTSPIPPPQIPNQKNVAKVLILFTDGSFQELK